VCCACASLVRCGGCSQRWPYRSDVCILAVVCDAGSGLVLHGSGHNDHGIVCCDPTACCTWHLHMLCGRLCGSFAHCWRNKQAFSQLCAVFFAHRAIRNGPAGSEAKRHTGNLAPEPEVKSYSTIDRFFVGFHSPTGRAGKLGLCIAGTKTAHNVLSPLLPLRPVPRRP
jgi:hypothetical protein